MPPVPTPPHPDDDAAALRFADLPRPALDRLPVQRVERAQEGLATQGRLSALLRAHRQVIGDPTLPAVLPRIVEAARDLVGARYAALGIASPAGGLAELVHVGAPEGTAARIGHPPAGKGLLGALLDEPRAIRLARIGDDPRCAGFPPGHPPMEGFLGAPIRIRGEVFGVLFLSESRKGEFTAEDEELLTALAATAGVAIDDARLHESARVRGEWLQASAVVTRQLLTTGPDAARPLQLIAERSREVAGADVALVLRPDQGASGADGRLRAEVAVGAGPPSLLGRAVPVATSLPGRVFRTGRPERVRDLDDPAGLGAVLSGEVDVGPLLAVPLQGSREVRGVLCLGRLRGRPAFGATDQDMAMSFADHAAVVTELAEARAQQHRAAVLDDCERIAADLHDHVIQRLFAAGLSLQTVATALGPGRMADRVTATVEVLDDTIRQIRSTIFQLQQEPQVARRGVREQVLGVVTDVTPALGFEPGIRFSGLIEDALPVAVVEDLVAVLREALTNVARHAGARTAEVDVTAAGGRLTLEVRDDGRGIGPAPARASGLTNMRRRAAAHGGAFGVAPAVPSGTRLSWSVPVR